MPTIRNETQTVLLISGAEDGGKPLRLAPGEKRSVEKINDALKRAEGNKLIRIFAERTQEKAAEPAKQQEEKKSTESQKPQAAKNKKGN